MTAETKWQQWYTTRTEIASHHAAYISGSLPPALTLLRQEAVVKVVIDGACCDQSLIDVHLVEQAQPHHPPLPNEG